MKYLFSVFQIVLIVLLILLVAIFVVVMSSENPEWIFNLLGIAENGESKYEALKFLGIGMGGLLVALQALMSYKRAKAMEDAAQAQADAVLKTEQGQRQDRLKNAIEHLGHESASVRLGGAYELFHLAEDTEDLRQTVLNILCDHIRRTTGESKYRETHKSKPSEEIQSLLMLLFVQEYEVFEDCYINLQGSWLNGAELFNANLRWAELSGTHLQGVYLSGAYLHGAFLLKAHMQGAYLDRARLQRASLYGAQLQGADLGKAGLRGADLEQAQLQGVDLARAQLQGAILGDVQLQGADLEGVQLQGAGYEEDVSDSFTQRMRQSIGQESDLSRVIFAGGLSQDDVDSFVKGLSDDEANELRKKLEPHIGKPVSHQLPEDSGAITGSYTEEEAEKWIAEYEKAMAEIPADDN